MRDTIELVIATSSKPADIRMGPANVFVFDMNGPLPDGISNEIQIRADGTGGEVDGHMFAIRLPRKRAIEVVNLILEKLKRPPVPVDPDE
jgi:hypothetical protein